MKREELKVDGYYAEKHFGNDWYLLRYVRAEEPAVKRPRYERALPATLVFEEVDAEKRSMDRQRRYDNARTIVTWDEYEAWKAERFGTEQARAANKARLVAACEALGLTASESHWNEYRMSEYPFDAHLRVHEEWSRCHIEVRPGSIERIAFLDRRPDRDLVSTVYQVMRKHDAGDAHVIGELAKLIGEAVAAAGWTRPEQGTAP